MTVTPLTIRRPLLVTMALPMDWLERASALPGKALHVALTLLYLMSLRRSSQVRFSQATLRRLSTSRDASYDALARMANAGLIRLDKRSGRAHLVTLLGAEGQPLRVL